MRNPWLFCLVKQNMETGWIKLHRKVMQKGWYKNSKYVHLWLHLLLKATHKQHEFMWNKEIIIIKEGQIVTGRKQLANETGINESTIEKILNLFEKEFQIEQQKTTKFRLITVINWTTHQEKEQQSNNRVTTKEQQNNTYKNDKKEKNEKNIATSVADMPFNQDNYIDEMRKSKQPQIRLIGWYFKKRGSYFPDEQTIKVEIKRWLKDAIFIIKFDLDRIDRTYKFVSQKFPEEWNLSTIKKYITEK
jgi:hypothetical protein